MPEAESTISSAAHEDVSHDGNLADFFLFRTTLAPVVIRTFFVAAHVLNIMLWIWFIDARGKTVVDTSDGVQNHWHSGAVFFGIVALVVCAIFIRVLVGVVIAIVGASTDMPATREAEHQTP